MDYPESNVPNKQHSTTLVPSKSMMQLTTVITQVMGDAHTKSTGSKEVGDKHLQTFHKLKPPLFKGAVGPQATKDWLLRIKKIFDNMYCPKSVRRAERYN
ncbi:hypothetical protein IEQ34_004967 [Dendrobium chrysotoxum]|uniref:Ty3-gypsy retrotransposon protein n=1 Tax=Dendrobium chrysotoxum TaxID=161865 RepID=A0AAV7GTR8_DENCH|nr:hypothetical protein IEQ34_004967 [Dendrobium chrysotoxum]